MQDDHRTSTVHPWHNRAKPEMRLFPGPSDLREAFIDSHGIDWVSSYIDECLWDANSRTLLARHKFARDKIRESASEKLRTLKLKVGVNPAPPAPVANSSRW